MFALLEWEIVTRTVNVKAYLSMASAANVETSAVVLRLADRIDVSLIVFLERVIVTTTEIVKTSLSLASAAIAEQPALFDKDALHSEPVSPIVLLERRTATTTAHA